MCSRWYQSQLNAIQGMLFYKHKNIKVWYSEDDYSIIHFFYGWSVFAASKFAINW